MSITKELENINELEAVGFDHKQAKAITKIIEQSHVDSHESLKEFIRSEFEKQNKDIDSKFKDFDSKLYALETRLISSQKDLLIKMFAIITGTAAMLFAMLKLFA